MRLVTFQIPGDASAAPRIEADGVVQVRRRFPMPADAILAYAEEIGADLLVMGTHGRTGIDRLSLGSTVESVLRRAPCPVLTVSPRAAGAAVGPVLAPLLACLRHAACGKCRLSHTVKAGFGNQSALRRHGRDVSRDTGYT